jgi:chemotaxis protein MotB
MAKNKHAHHGGAWKVAYADFVTAMMALFLVLWLTSQDEKIKEAVERSFKNPFMSLTKESTGLIANKDAQAVKSHEGNFDSASAVELNMLRKLSQDLMKSLENNNENPEDNPIRMEMTPEGMRISIFDRSRKPIFEQDSAKFTTFGEWIFSTLAWEISRYTNNFAVELEGHTELGHKPKNPDYGVWEVSTDRANSARRRLLQHGVQHRQIRKVAGYADTMPLSPANPSEEANRRVTVMLKVNGQKNN